MAGHTPDKMQHAESIQPAEAIASSARDLQLTSRLATAADCTTAEECTHRNAAMVG